MLFSLLSLCVLLGSYDHFVSTPPVYVDSRYFNTTQTESGAAASVQWSVWFQKAQEQDWSHGSEGCSAPDRMARPLFRCI